MSAALRGPHATAKFSSPPTHPTPTYHQAAHQMGDTRTELDLTTLCGRSRQMSVCNAMYVAICGGGRRQLLAPSSTPNIMRNWVVWANQVLNSPCSSVVYLVQLVSAGSCRTRLVPWYWLTLQCWYGLYATRNSIFRAPNQL